MLSQVLFSGNLPDLMKFSVSTACFEGVLNFVIPTLVKCRRSLVKAR